MTPFPSMLNPLGYTMYVRPWKIHPEGPSKRITSKMSHVAI